MNSEKQLEAQWIKMATDVATIEASNMPLKEALAYIKEHKLKEYLRYPPNLLGYIHDDLMHKEED